jgi:DNA transformation protein
MTAVKMRNIGPKSAAWLRQVGLRSLEDLAAAGTVEAFMRVKRAGFKPGLNLLYAIEGALLDCHWQEVPDERRQELIAAAEAAIALLPPPRNRPAAGPVTTTSHMSDAVAEPAGFETLSDARDGAEGADD